MLKTVDSKLLAFSSSFNVFVNLSILFSLQNPFERNTHSSCFWRGRQFTWVGFILRTYTPDVLRIAFSYQLKVDVWISLWSYKWQSWFRPFLLEEVDLMKYPSIQIIIHIFLSWGYTLSSKHAANFPFLQIDVNIENKTFTNNSRLTKHIPK